MSEHLVSLHDHKRPGKKKEWSSITKAYAYGLRRCLFSLPSVFLFISFFFFGPGPVKLNGIIIICVFNALALHYHSISISTPLSTPCYPTHCITVLLWDDSITGHSLAWRSILVQVLFWFFSRATEREQTEPIRCTPHGGKRMDESSERRRRHGPWMGSWDHQQRPPAVHPASSACCMVHGDGAFSRQQL